MFENVPKKLINTILTAVSAVVMMMWVWKYFGPGGGEMRARGNAQAAAIGLGFGDFIQIGIAVACGGYLLWRLLSYLFWRKYFKDELPPDEPED